MIIEQGSRLALIEINDQLTKAIERGDKEAFEKLGGLTADLNFEISKEGIFPLTVASAKGDKEMVSLIVQNPKTDINKTDSYGVNSFWIASYYGKIDIMMLLMSKGIDLMCKNQNGSNALHIAVKRQNVQVVQALLNINYPLDYAKNNGVTAIGIAAFSGNLEILQMLHEAGADLNATSKSGTNPLYLAIKQNQIECVRYLIANKAVIHMKDPSKHDYSPLFLAIKMNNLEVLDQMLSTGFNLNNVRHATGFTPLQFAIYHSSKNAFQALIDNTKNLNARDPEGYSPLMRCVLNGFFETADHLIARGADVNQVTKEGKTALTLAIDLGNQDAVEYLLKKKADPTIKDKDGKNALDYALESEIFANHPLFQRNKNTSSPKLSLILPNQASQKRQEPQMQSQKAEAENPILYQQSAHKQTSTQPHDPNQRKRYLMQKYLGKTFEQSSSPSSQNRLIDMQQQNESIVPEPKQEEQKQLMHETRQVKQKEAIVTRKQIRQPLQRGKRAQTVIKKGEQSQVMKSNETDQFKILESVLPAAIITQSYNTVVEPDQEYHSSSRVNTQRKPVIHQHVSKHNQPKAKQYSIIGGVKQIRVTSDSLPINFQRKTKRVRIDISGQPKVHAVQDSPNLQEKREMNIWKTGNEVQNQNDNQSNYYHTLDISGKNYKSKQLAIPPNDFSQYGNQRIPLKKGNHKNLNQTFDHYEYQDSQKRRPNYHETNRSHRSFSRKDNQQQRKRDFSTVEQYSKQATDNLSKLRAEIEHELRNIKIQQSELLMKINIQPKISKEEGNGQNVEQNIRHAESFGIITNRSIIPYRSPLLIRLAGKTVDDDLERNQQFQEQLKLPQINSMRGNQSLHPIKFEARNQKQTFQKNYHNQLGLNLKNDPSNDKS